jgi:hypothetical protein
VTSVDAVLRSATVLLPSLPSVVTEAAESITQPRGLNANAALLDLRLPTRIVGVFEPVLARAGFVIDVDVLEDPYSPQRRSISLVTDRGIEVYLAHVPCWVLQDAENADNRAAFDYLAPSFERISNVFIISEGCETPDLSFTRMMSAWERFGVTVEFISWRHLMDFADKNEEEQAFVLRSLFSLDLDGSQGLRDDVAIDDLKPGELKQIVAILAQRATNAPTGATLFFRSFVGNLYLPQELAAQVADPWTGDAEADARTLLAWAFGVGRYPNPDRRAYSVAGAILESLAEDDQGPDGRELARVILRYRLIGDPDVVAALRSRLARENG